MDDFVFRTERESSQVVRTFGADNQNTVRVQHPDPPDHLFIGERRVGRYAVFYGERYGSFGHAVTERVLYAGVSARMLSQSKSSKKSRCLALH